MIDIRYIRLHKYVCLNKEKTVLKEYNAPYWVCCTLGKHVMSELLSELSNQLRLQQLLGKTIKLL